MLKPKQSLGQNFLRDNNILRKIDAAFDARADDAVLEIGPGEGALTRLLAERTHILTCVEIDQRAVPLLRATLPPYVEIEHADVLEYDIAVLARRRRARLRVVGNIPYNISSQILFALFDAHESVNDVMLMLQREVAERLTAVPRTKEYGILSVMTQIYAFPRLLFRVPPTCFYPVPKVESAVAHLQFKRELPAQDLAFASKLIHTAFGKRRKMLRSCLRAAGITQAHFNEANLTGTERAEELSPEQFLAFAALLERRKRELSL